MSDGHTEEFVRKLTGSQNSLFAYIYALLPNRDQAWDLLQDTNVVLWSKAAEFAPGTDFLSWARQVAYYEILNYRRRRGQNPQLFTPELLQALAAEAQQRIHHTDERARALDDCLDALPLRQRELIRRRYEPDGSVKELAAQLGQSASTVSVTLTRIRRALLDCVQRKLPRRSAKV